MNENITTNIRRRREHFSWTQEHLAAAAALNVRTIQRAEEGRPVSAESLAAIAGALDVSIDQLRIGEEIEFLAALFSVPPEQVTPELIQSKIDEASAKYFTIPLSAVDCSADLRAVLGTSGYVFECAIDADEIQDLAADLQQWIADLGDIAAELGPAGQREQLKALYEVVKQLNELGAGVSVGRHKHLLTFPSGPPLPWTTVYVIVSPKEELKRFAMIEKGVHFDLT